jgi:hypothetical protein
MPRTAKGAKILRAMRKRYGKARGTRIFHASRNAGVIRGVERRTRRRRRSASAGGRR